MKNTMKKLIAALMAAAIVLSLCACGKTTKKKNIEDLTFEDFETAAEKLSEMDDDDISAALEAAFN